ncbi:hypothetical protein KUTeg_018967 [Tegillarca granosa]|uniref:Uncharacterized protein n=1 Tax=Tegillarca granosa TaxID=220873 RepID=A0ABQ9EB54_TEGGR|nr:hypothetical protein KUTeg_018967 [Tegillarca granosa]
MATPNKEALPLVLEDQLIDDDWLIDDMNLRPSKRRKMDIDGVFSTNSARNVTKQGNKSNRILEESDSDTNEVMSDVNVISENVTIENENDILDAGTDDVEMLFNADDLNMDNVLNDDLPSMNYTDKNKITNKRNRLSTKPRQLRMTNFGVRQNVQSQNLASHELPSSCNHVVSSDIGLPSTQSSLLTSQSLSVMRVKVKVKDKLLLIPVSQR